MIPLVDMMNHADDGNVRITTDAAPITSDAAPGQPFRVAVVASRAIDAGEALLHDYYAEDHAAAAAGGWKPAVRGADVWLTMHGFLPCHLFPQAFCDDLATAQRLAAEEGPARLDAGAATAAGWAELSLPVRRWCESAGRDETRLRDEV